MKKTLLLCLALTLTAVAQAFTVVVRSTSGDTGYDSSQIENVSFGETGAVTLSLLNGDEVVIPADQFKAIGFSAETSAQEIKSDKLQLRVYAGLLYADSLNPIEVYDLQGKLLMRGQSGKIETRRLGKGVYVVKCGKLSTKLLIP